MLVNLKVKTLDANTHEFSIDNEITVREFKDTIAERTNISADLQRIIYCGRVLSDEKQMKEYDVDGKVVHVAERPPPSQRGPSSSGSSNAFPNDNGGNVRPPRGMRNSPLFRALDGMVVGTMAIPVNAASMNSAQVPVNPFTSSSSFCMNRITVARHMLDCANNIANYLEDPERGLNNTSLDILARGRWTMESTVVEVGISAGDMPQNQNIVDMVQGAVSAALRRNGNTNVTVVQLPTVFGSNEAGSGGVGAEAIDGGHSASDTMESNDASTSDGGGVGGAPTATVIIEDVIDGDDEDDDIDDDEEEDGATNASSSAAQAGSAASNSSASTGGGGRASLTVAMDAANNSSTSTGTNTDDNPARRRTGTTVLAEVVEQMRTVQTRLNPFIQQFYDMLLNEPSFEENDTAGRENAQRLYDRVSEAFHYMSHAQHAISDLMLDISQPTPRYLTCRPILVEQSGYVSSNNYLSAAAAAAAAAAAGIRQIPQQARSANSTGGDANATAAAAGANTPTAASGATAIGEPVTTPTAAESAATTRSAETEAGGGGAVEDPVDDPIVAPIIPAAAAAAAAGANAAHVGTQSNAQHQLQMARLIQAVVNAAPIETEFHVQINAPSIVSFGVPINAAAAARHSNARRQQNATPTENGAAVNGNGGNGNGGDNGAGSGESAATSPTAGGTTGNNQARVNTATLPTTATQTRSTSRPQLQIGNLPNPAWNGRFIPANMMSSFDRFLPCNSHHTRDPENNAATTTNGNGTPAAARAGTAAAAVENNLNMANANAIRDFSSILQQDIIQRHPLLVGSTMTNPRSNGDSAAHLPPSPHLVSLRNLLSNMTASPQAPAGSGRASRSSSAGRPTGGAAVASEVFSRNLRAQLLNFVNVNVFAGASIDAETMPPAINRAISWFDDSLMYLPQYEKPQYDSRDSLCNILRRTLPLLVAVINDGQETPAQFETRLKQIFEKLKVQLFSTLCVCTGRPNAEMYWGQLMRLLLVPVRLNFRDEALQFLASYVNSDFPLNLDLDDAQQFVVSRSPATEKKQEKPTPMDTDVEMAEAGAASTSDPKQWTGEATEEPEAPEEPLPTVEAGTEPWHHHYPNSWLPVLTRDLQTQPETQTQAPFSDAYISGMSAKRRKLIQSNKPPTDVRSLVADSVRRALQTVGVTTTTASNQSQSADEVTNAIASDNSVQASYTEAVRTNVRERLMKDPDYKADKYPQTTKFLNNTNK